MKPGCIVVSVKGSMHDVEIVQKVAQKLWDRFIESKLELPPDELVLLYELLKKSGANTDGENK
jgi:hypothetical protein